MNLNILLFGITREIIGASPYSFAFSGQTVDDLKEELFSSYPKLKELKSFMVAVNSEYVRDDHKINESDEIALIPPVSGG